MNDIISEIFLASIPQAAWLWHKWLIRMEWIWSGEFYSELVQKFALM